MCCFIILGTCTISLFHSKSVRDKKKNACMRKSPWNTPQGQTLLNPEKKKDIVNISKPNGECQLLQETGK